MAKYLDHHKVVQMPPQAAQKMIGDIKAGRADSSGVKPLNAFIAKNEMWCLAEAPNVDTICKAHEAYGLKLGKGDVMEVNTLV
ncbi:MAG: hypothetical protein HYU29_06985 [Chloroflexi bacterium]|nr:hypothetical protein [Chloroflexota bacterium]